MSSLTNRNRRLKHRHLSHANPPTHKHTYTHVRIQFYILHMHMFTSAIFCNARHISVYFTPILVNFKFVKSSHIFIYAFFYFFQIYAMCNMMKEYNRTECVPVCARTAYTWESVLYSKCNKIRSFYSKFFSNKNLSSFGVN